MIIYLTGIDGSGKTTLGNWLKQELEKTAPCRLVWARYEPRLLALLTAPFRKRVTHGQTDLHRMTAEEYGRWRAFKHRLVQQKCLSRMLYFLQYADYSRQIRTTIPAKVDGHLVVDRYVLDFIVDQTINHGNVEQSPWTRRLLRRMNRFDAVFFIDTAPEIALARKQDIPSLEYLHERRAVYGAFMKNIPNGWIIENNGDLEAAKADLARIVIPWA